MSLAGDRLRKRAEHVGHLFRTHARKATKHVVVKTDQFGPGVDGLVPSRVCGCELCYHALAILTEVSLREKLGGDREFESLGRTKADEVLKASIEATYRNFGYALRA